MRAQVKTQSYKEFIEQIYFNCSRTFEQYPAGQLFKTHLSLDIQLIIHYF